MRLPRWLRPVHDLPTRAQVKERTAEVEDLAARGDKAVETARTFQAQNRFADLIRRSLIEGPDHQP